MTNETYATSALREYYNATPYVIRVIQFDRFLAQLKIQSPTFMEQFGRAVATVVQSKRNAAMADLGRKATRLEFNPAPYFEALATVGVALSFSDVAKAAGSGVVEAGEKLISIGSKSLMIYVAIAAFGVFVLPKILKGGGK